MKLWQAFALIVLSFVVVGVVGGGGPPSAVADSQPQSRGVNARIIGSVTLPYGAQSSRIFANWYHFPALDTTTAKDTLAASADLVEPDYIATIDGSYLESALLNQVSAPTAWPTSTGAGVTIAIIDTGVDCTHPSLAARCSGDADVNGHGTHVAGLAAGIAIGASIKSYRVMDESGSGPFSMIAQAITQAAADGARVENLSLGCTGCISQMMADAIHTAQQLGTVVVAAAGNDGSTTPSIPAFYASLAVAAVTDSDGLVSWSNRGSWVNVAAPGVNLMSTCMGGGYCAKSGTSMASPVAAGVAALAAAAHPGASGDDVAAYVMAGDLIAGQTFRRVNAAKAVGATGGAPQPTSTALAGRATATPTAGDYGAQLISLVNDQRRAVGLSALATVASLNSASDTHNRFMASNSCFAHQCAGEPDPGTRARSAGYPSAGIGENIAGGYITPQDVMNGWMNSAGHRANILGAYTDIGCAYLANPNGAGIGLTTIDEAAGPANYATLWTCDFGSAGAPSQPLPTLTPTPRVPPPPILTPQPTPRGALPPGGWVFRVELQPSAGWQAWDDLYYHFCASPLSGVACSWYRR